MSRHTTQRPVRAVRRAVRLLALGALSALASGCAPGGDGRSAIQAPESYSFWPLFPAEPRVQFLTSYRFSDDVEPQRSGLEDIIYGEERRVLPINKPYGLDMYDGKIYVCDTKNAGVIILDLPAQETRLMGATGMARMQSPTDVAIAPDGMTYITDSVRGVIFVFDGQERYVTAIGREGMKPAGIDLLGDELFVSDLKGKTVEVFDRGSGEHLRSFGGPGIGEGQFTMPLGLAIGPQGTIYVSDVVHCRVQCFAPDGTFLSSFGEVGATLGRFRRPKLLDVDEDGIIYVVDSAFSNVQMFNSDNELLMFFGSAGPHPGSMHLPVGVESFDDGLELFAGYVHPAFEAQRLLLVTNQFGVNKVSVYAVGKLKEGRTVQDIARARAPMGSGTIEDEEAVRDQLLLLPEEAQEPGTEPEPDEPAPQPEPQAEEPQTPGEDEG